MYLKTKFLASLSLIFLALKAQAQALETFESKHSWQFADWSDQAKFEVSKEQFSEGQQSLKVYWEEGAKKQGKGIILERDISALGREFTSVRLDVQIPDISSASMAIAIESDEYYESPSLPLESGWNKDMVFFLKTKNWKAKSTSWQYQAAVNLAVAPKKIFLLFYLPVQPTGQFFVDNIRLTQELEPQIRVGPQAEVQPVRTKKNHYRPRELPLEIFIHP
ncbi:MAG: hypothetical protein NTX25_05995 [Proteobacteria bacterium]|nr:hypothetical protein [Pseudomonadota bacterium]